MCLHFDSFIESYGTHIVTSATIGGRDVVYIRQHQSSPLTVTDIETYVKDIADQRFQESSTTSAPLNYKDKVIITSVLWFFDEFGSIIDSWVVAACSRF